MISTQLFDVGDPPAELVLQGLRGCLAVADRASRQTQRLTPPQIGRPSPDLGSLVSFRISARLSDHVPSDVGGILKRCDAKLWSWGAKMLYTRMLRHCLDAPHRLPTATGSQSSHRLPACYNLLWVLYQSDRKKLILMTVTRQSSLKLFTQDSIGNGVNASGTRYVSYLFARFSKQVSCLSIAV